VKIGVIVDSFRLPLREGIKKAKEIGADAIQMYAVSGDMAPENLTPKARKELLSYIRDNGLVISALCGDLGGHGFAIQADNPVKIERSKLILDLAKDMETDIVTTHIGVVPSSPTHERYEILLEACEQLGEYADQIGASFAIETGPERAIVLKEFLDRLHSGGVKVNYDPANFVMVTGDDPIEGVYTLRDYIVHTHAKDGVMLKQSDPEVVYHFFAEGGIEDFRLEDYFKELPLGKGHVDFQRYLQALKEIGYTGFHTIEREVGENPAHDIREAVAFLKTMK
jgi:L-ribulose-5-phosphate 3-epimerase